MGVIMSVRGIRLAAVMEHGIDEFFYCWIRRAKSEGLAEGFELHKPSEFVKISWTEISYTTFKESAYIKPKGIYTVSLRSRELFSYGVFQMITKLPKWKDGPSLWFGFEADDLFGGGVIHFQYHNARLRAYVGAWPKPLAMDITDFALPSDYATKRHTYSVYVYNGLALWYVDDVLRACALLSHKDSNLMGIISEGPPYSLSIASMKPSNSLAILIDIDGGDISREWVWNDFHPWQLRVLPGEPKPLLILSLYAERSNIKLIEKEVKDIVTSHPIPLLPFEKGTLHFESDVKGQLTLECYTVSDTWKEYDEFEIVGSKLMKYSINDKIIALRVKYAPSTRPAKVRVGEIILK